MNSNDIKKDFPIFESNPDLVYLDNSSTSQTPEQVLRAMDSYYRDFRANTRRGQYPLATRAEDAYEKARGSVASFIGADAGEIIFTSGATASMNLLLLSLDYSEIFKEGDEIVTTVMEHHSVLVPLQELAKRRGLTLKFIPIKENFELDYEEAEKIVGTRTRALVFTAASNVTGTVNDAKRLAQLAKKVGALSIVDAAQAAGHIELSVKDIDCDFLFFSGHKMCGPTGIGALYGKKELLEKLSPGFFGGGMIDFASLETAEHTATPHRFEAGTPNIASAIGLGAASDYLSKISITNIRAHIEELTAHTLEELKKLPFIKIYSHQDPKKNSGVISFSFEGIHPHDVAEVFSREGIAIRAGHHCAMPIVRSLDIPALARASFYIYNSPEDVSALVSGLKKAAAVFEPKSS